MTVDYTKPSEIKSAKPLKAEAIQTQIESHEEPKPHELEERICSQCYAIGRSRIIESGSWLGFILPMFFDEPVKLYGCRQCNHVNSMIPLKSREGEQAMYWHLKDKSSNKTNQF